MDKQQLIDVLGRALPKELATDLAEQFLMIRQDVATRTLGRSAPGKFVESFVQALQQLESGKYDRHPEVDGFLRGLESRSSTLHDGLRLCATRVARAMYTLRNKRNIAHKGEIDPNNQDLGLVHSMAQWIMAELIRTLGGLPMEDAGKLVAQVEAPIGGLVEDFGNRKLVLADLSAPDEVLGAHAQSLSEPRIIGRSNRVAEQAQGEYSPNGSHTSLATEAHRRRCVGLQVDAKRFSRGNPCYQTAACPYLLG